MMALFKWIFILCVCKKIVFKILHTNMSTTALHADV